MSSKILIYQKSTCIAINTLKCVYKWLKRKNHDDDDDSIRSNI